MVEVTLGAIYKLFYLLLFYLIYICIYKSTSSQYRSKRISPYKITICNSSKTKPFTSKYSSDFKFNIYCVTLCTGNVTG